MKKLLAILMSLLVVMSLTTISAFALEEAQTSVTFSKGDEVIYTLKLTTPEKVVGCDFSIYYDSTVLKVKEVADFTGNYDSDEHQAVINSNLEDEVIGNWSILSGVSFDNRSLVSIKFEATQSATTNITYYVRYLYPVSLEQFTDYTFKCDVKVNGTKVIDNAAPQLNTTDKQSQGLFVNSVTGDGEDANVNMAGGTTMESNENDVNGGASSEVNTTETKSTQTNSTDSSVDSDATTDVETDSESTPDTIVASPSQTDTSNSIFSSVWFWVIAAIVIVGGGFGAVYVVKSKKGKAE